MRSFKQIAGALTLFGLYALIAGKAPSFSGKETILAAKVGYNMLSMLVWVGFVGLVVWVLKPDGNICVERKDSWRWLVVRFISSIVLAFIILLVIRLLRLHRLLVLRCLLILKVLLYIEIYCNICILLFNSIFSFLRILIVNYIDFLSAISAILAELSLVSPCTLE